MGVGGMGVGDGDAPPGAGGGVVGIGVDVARLVWGVGVLRDDDCSEFNRSSRALTVAARSGVSVARGEAGARVVGAGRASQVPVTTPTIKVMMRMSIPAKR
ncbi:MAG: hypothetical protein D6802_02190 [Ardenticatenia bacterium]|nr:MAG: hypothetical protein D6802_02190 [Ardenticatenia bacterium]